MKWIKNTELKSLFDEFWNGYSGTSPITAKAFYHFLELKLKETSSHPEQGEQGELYKWVKASERLPDDFGFVLLKMSDGYHEANFAKDRDGFLFQIPETHEEFYEATFHGIEWLCKLSSPPPEGQLKK